MPSRSVVPGRKFCTRTSLCATSLAITSRPASLLTSIDSERLPRLEEMNSAENSPALSMTARLRRVMSPPIGSILSTSAPWSARNIVAYGPETTPVRSSTRTPFKGPAIGSFPQFEHHSHSTAHHVTYHTHKYVRLTSSFAISDCVSPAN